MIKISVIVTTYNRADALALVLKALAAQKNPKIGEPIISAFEVIVTDDGSMPAAAELTKTLQPHLPYPLQFLWQEDKGFRAAKARNRAIAAAQGKYFIFLDGDCIPPSDFIARHCQLAEKNCFVAGNRILLSQKFTAAVLQKSFQGNIWTWRITQWLLPYLRRDINRFLPLLRLPNSPLRKRKKQKWQGAKTCNLAVWREDILKIKGFDEQFQGWGHEDAELVVRLLHNEVQRKEGRFAVPVFHLWHLEQDRRFEKKNRQRLEQKLCEERFKTI